jgi:hypothetical protein
MELFKAHKQWAERPDDERFSSLAELHAACKEYASSAAEKNVPFSDMRVENLDGDVQLVGRAGVPAKLTHWAFSQLCSRVEVPASYLRDLPATLACQNLNHGLAQRVKDVTGNALASLLFHKNGGLLLRAITTDSYARIWNYEVAERLMDLEGSGWKPATPDIRKIDDKLPLYASDHDMFVFLSNRNVTVSEAGSSGAVYRGVIVENSEVGASALKLTRFLYREMCGNHIIWGASNVMEISVRHVGEARQKWNHYAMQMRRYAESSASDDEAKIASAKRAIIGGTKEDVLDALFGKRSLGLSRKAIESGYDACIEAQDGSPKTQWGIVQGLTRYSQTIPYADKRTSVDVAAGKIMDLVF